MYIHILVYISMNIMRVQSSKLAKPWILSLMNDFRVSFFMILLLNMTFGFRLALSLR